MSEGKWWFGFRQTSPKPLGQAIACGPYESYEKAKVEREKSKAWDCGVSILYSDSSKEEAVERAKHFLS
jgi:hypothetical protein